MDLIDLLVLVLVFWLGWRLRGWWMIITMAQNPEPMMAALKRVQQLNTEAESTGPRRIRVERIGLQLYLYAEDNDEFLAQGHSLEEAIAQIELRFPGDEFRGHISREDLERLNIKLEQK